MVPTLYECSCCHSNKIVVSVVQSMGIFFSGGKNIGG